MKSGNRRYGPRPALTSPQPRPAVRCAASAAISSGWAHCDGCGDRSRHPVIDVRVLRCRGTERRGGTVGRVRREQP